MNGFITCIDEKIYYERYSNYREVHCLSSSSDIATFVDTFEASGLKGYNIVKVLEAEGKYIFVYNANNTGYDLIKEINKLSTLGINITTQNVKLLYGKDKSRGYFSEDSYNAYSLEDQVTGEIGSDLDNEVTGFLDEEQHFSSNRILIHNKTNARLPINDYHGVKIGRNSVKSEYVVPNSNMSRLHARVYLDGNKCMVHDYKSANGTYIDGLKVNETLDRELLVGSTLKLGNEEFTLE